MYKTQRNYVVSKLRSAKRDYYDNLITSNIHKSDRMCASIKQLIPSSKGISTASLNIDGQNVTDKGKIEKKESSSVNNE